MSAKDGEAPQDRQQREALPTQDLKEGGMAGALRGRGGSCAEGPLAGAGLSINKYETKSSKLVGESWANRHQIFTLCHLLPGSPQAKFDCGPVCRQWDRAPYPSLGPAFFI